MALSRNLMVGGIAASRAGVVGIVSALRTGRNLGVMMDEVMAQCIKCFSDNISTIGANLMSGSAFGTGRIFVDDPISVGMALGRKNHSVSLVSTP